MKISIFGLGYVGAVSLACLARDGHSVVGVDIDPAKLEMIRAGRSPLVEEGMLELMAQAAASGRIGVTDDARAAIHATELSFVCVGTPSSANGSQDQSAVRASRDIGRALHDKREAHTWCSAPPWCPARWRRRCATSCGRIGKREAWASTSASSPSSCARAPRSDYDNPPFTIVGTDSAVVVGTRALFGHLPAEFHAIRSGGGDGEVLLQQLSRAQDHLRQRDRAPVRSAGRGRGRGQGSCAATRLNISRAYLRPLRLRRLVPAEGSARHRYLAKMRDVELPMLAGVLASTACTSSMRWTRSSRRGAGASGWWGCRSSGTDDLRESPLVRLAEECLGKGCSCWCTTRTCICPGCWAPTARSSRPPSRTWTP
jgi:GDP-mannose 6-dehydrogenase